MTQYTEQELAKLKASYDKYDVSMETEYKGNLIELFQLPRNKVNGKIEKLFDEIRAGFDYASLLKYVTYKEDTIIIQENGGFITTGIQEIDTIGMVQRRFFSTYKKEHLLDLMYITYRKELCSNVSSYIGSYSEFLQELFYYLQSKGFTDIKGHMDVFADKLENLYKEYKAFDSKIKTITLPSPYSAPPEFFFHTFIRHDNVVKIDESDSSASLFGIDFTGSDLADLSYKLCKHINKDKLQISERNPLLYEGIYLEDNKNIYLVVVKINWELHTTFQFKDKDKEKIKKKGKEIIQIPNE